MQRNMAHLRSSGLSNSLRLKIRRQRSLFGSTSRLSANLTHANTNTPSVEHLQMPLSPNKIPKSTSCELVKALENVVKSLGMTDEEAHSYALNMQRRQEEHEVSFQLVKEKWRRNVTFEPDEKDSKNSPPQPSQKIPDTTLGPLKDLEAAIRTKDIKIAMNSFRTYAHSPGKEFSLKHFNVYKKLIKMIGPNLQASCIIFWEFESLLTDFNNSEGSNAEEKSVDDYNLVRGVILDHMVSVLGAPIGHKVTNRNKYERIVENLIDKVCSLPRSELKYVLIPKLMNSLLTGKGNWGKVKDMELGLWKYMLDLAKNDPSFISGVNLYRFEKLLEHSNYRSQMELPFVQLLRMVVEKGTRPQPAVVVNVLHNEFPFQKCKSVLKLLQTIIQLEKDSVSLYSGLNYHIDLGTLEHLSATASKKGRSDIILLVWEYMEIMRLSEDKSHGITPSQSLHESAAQAFVCSNLPQDHMTFNVFAEMEEQGYEINRSLLQSISRSTRTRLTVGRINNMRWILKNYDTRKNNSNTAKPTSAALNCILACYGQLGEVQRALETFDEFGLLGCQTTPETFEFLMEAIKEDINTAIPPFLHGIGTNYVDNENEYDFEEWRQTQLETAEAILETCIEQGHPMNKYMLNSYIQILCTGDELEKAKQFLSELLESEEDLVQQFSPQCFSVLALSYAHRGLGADAQEVINMNSMVGLSDQLPKHVMERVARLQQKSKLSFKV